MESIRGYEILVGPAGKRRWPNEVKGQLVAETYLPGVCPAVRQPDIGIGLGIDNPVVAGIAIDLQDALKALQNLHRMVARPSRRIGKGNTGRIVITPWAVIAGQCPE